MSDDSHNIDMISRLSFESKVNLLGHRQSSIDDILDKYNMFPREFTDIAACNTNFASTFGSSIRFHSVICQYSCYSMPQVSCDYRLKDVVGQTT